MPVLRSVTDFNWKYAFSEILLIVIGVTIALAGTAWYEERGHRIEEISVLQQLRETLEEDLQDVIGYKSGIDEIEQNIRGLIIHIESDQPYTEELDYYFGSLASWRSTTIRMAPFETLKSGGFELISSETLRKKLIAFYEDTYPTLQSNSGIDRDFVRQKVWAYFFENFYRPDLDSRRWSPVDYEMVRKEPYVLNLCKWRVRSLNRFLRGDFETAITQIRELLNEIEVEISATE